MSDLPIGAGTGAGPTPKARGGGAGYWPIGRCWEGNARPKCAGTPSTGLCTIYGRKVRDTRRFEVDLQVGKGSNQPPRPIRPKGTPLEV
jgi:hypothetical protein